MLTFCSIASRYSLPHAQVLADALERQHPEARLSILVLGDAIDSVPDARFEVIRPGDLDLGSARNSIEDQGWADLALIFKPFLIRLTLERFGGTVVFIEADVDVVAPLDRAISLSSAHGVVLVPRVLEGEGIPDDGLEPSDRDLLDVGRISPALLTVTAGTTADRFLAWWADRLSETAQTLEPEELQPTNLVKCSPALTRWLDVADAVFPSTLGILDDPGLLASYWNLHRRELKMKDGALSAGGRALCCLQFAGFRPNRPYWLSEDATRPRVLDDPVLTSLCASYGQRLLDAGWVSPPKHADHSVRLANGVSYDLRLRRLHRRALSAGAAFGDVTTAEGTEAFMAWLAEPAERGEKSRIGRYLYDVYAERTDLQEAFPELEDRADAQGLIDWAWGHGTSELGLAPELLPAHSSWSQPDGRRIAVNVAGYLTESHGLAQAARLYLTALQVAGVPVSTMAAPVHLPVKEPQELALARYGRQHFDQLELPYTAPFNLLCVNPDGLPGLLESAGDLLRGAHYTIGQWGWETDVLPPHWQKSFELIDELWVYSKYVADNLSQWSPVPVITMPLPVIAPDPGQTDVGLAADFAFLFVFDFFSTIQRKNPVGLIDAFTHAFKPGEGPKLVLKAMNGSFRPQAVEEIRWAIGDRSDIELIDRHVDKQTYAAMIAACDCYVSLHRAEGYGLTLAEAMALGKPVIATGYSGNLDFMTPANSYLVDFALTSVGPDGENYPTEGTWAEPDLDHAAALMRQVWEQREEARAKGDRAAHDVAEALSPEAVGRRLRARLELLSVRDSRSVPESRPPDFDELERNLAFASEGSLYARHRGLARFLRRLVLRLMRPFTHYQSQLDHAIVEQLKRISAELSDDRAARADDLARLRRLENRVEAAKRRDADGRTGKQEAAEAISPVDRPSTSL